MSEQDHDIARNSNAVEILEAKVRRLEERVAALESASPDVSSLKGLRDSLRELEKRLDRPIRS